MEVKKICVLGAGAMGNQIAQLAAQSGYDVSMRDIEDKFVQKGLATIKANLKKFFVDKGKITPEKAEEVLNRIEGTTDLKKSVAGAQLVIECIPEVMKLKQQMFKELDKICAPETILASNTSSLSITAIGSLTKRQDKVIGMHFFNPVTVLRLIEIIRSAKTSDETYETIKVLSRKFGDEVITSGDAPGFIVTRLFVTIINEAAKIVSQGIATPEDVDKGCRLGLGHAMGPLTTMDMTGIDIAVHVLQYMEEQLGEFYKPSPLLTEKAQAGHLGRKTGKGIYDYSK